MAEFSIGEILRRAVGKRREIKAGVTHIAEPTGSPISKPLFDYLFTTQAAVESKGAMDYHQYPEFYGRIWFWVTRLMDLKMILILKTLKEI